MTPLNLTEMFWQKMSFLNPQLMVRLFQQTHIQLAQRFRQIILYFDWCCYSLTCIMVQFKNDSVMLKGKNSVVMRGDNAIEIYSRGPLSGSQGAWHCIEIPDIQTLHACPWWGFDWHDGHRGLLFWDGGWGTCVCAFAGRLGWGVTFVLAPLRDSESCMPGPRPRHRG